MNAVAILAVVMAGCFWEWRDFVLDIRRETRAPVELGKDDMESVYLTLTGLYLKDGYKITIQDEVMSLRDSLSTGEFQQEENEGFAAE